MSQNTESENQVEILLQDDQNSQDEDWSSFFLGWTSTLALVFLSGATMNSTMRWCSNGYTWDIGGTIFSAILTYLTYHFIISGNVKLSRADQWKFAIFLPATWLLIFPILMHLLGFK
ncbi:MAG: hypothetical protein HQM08_05485 [Candidatus Riflebacteria bacterium]|nr:hypothetical protein [Candidatus Riflebacteria bacterium]